MKKHGPKPLYDEMMSLSTVYLPFSMKKFAERNGGLSALFRELIQERMNKEAQNNEPRA